MNIVNERIKDLLSKEHYCHKIHASLIEQCFSLSIDNPTYMENPPFIFPTVSWSPLLWFFKNLNPPINKVGNSNVSERSYHNFKELTRKTDFLGWSGFKFNKLGLVLSMALTLVTETVYRLLLLMQQIRCFRNPYWRRRSNTLLFPSAIILISRPYLWRKK